ncbi:MAG: membrane protein insertion efficiency factor YidD [Acutalibacteraceae bacterium]|nr:membrane protein insertion efficiency factor YidD [Acutalibacteraceae bacterium]
MRNLFLLPVWIYRKCISPFIPAHCRFTPTCSQYAIQAVQIHGIFKGTYLSFKRILRCNPFCKGGYDPVPPKKQK